jgi:hypothetical protein
MIQRDAAKAESASIFLFLLTMVQAALAQKV